MLENTGLIFYQSIVIPIALRKCHLSSWLPFSQESVSFILA